MNSQHLNLIRTHFGNPKPFWVDERDEHGYFPESPTPESVAHPVDVIDGKVVPAKLEMTMNDKPITDARYVAYVSPQHFDAGDYERFAEQVKRDDINLGAGLTPQ